MSEPTTENGVSPLTGPLEALLLMATEPVPTAELAQAVLAPEAEVEEALAGLVAFYDATGRGFELRRVGTGWRYYTREEYADLIGHWLLEGQQGKLSQAALETLAVVAYLQPVSRGRVSAVRGVNVDGVMRTLAARDLIEEVGTSAETGARLFGTTASFLEKMGLTSLDELPPIAPYLPEAAALEAELIELAAPASEAPRESQDVLMDEGEGDGSQGHGDGSRCPSGQNVEIETGQAVGTVPATPERIDENTDDATPESIDETDDTGGAA